MNETTQAGNPGDPFDLPPIREGRYGQFDLIGAGGWGVVYSALDRELRRRVALKVMKPPAARRLSRDMLPMTPVELPAYDEDAPVERTRRAEEAWFLEEPILTSRLEHPGIVPVYELGRLGNGLPYYTMRLLRGDRNLGTSIALAMQRPVRERLELLDDFLSVCDAVAFMHAQGILHRDIKPENVVVDAYGQVVVLDLGLARLAGGGGHSFERVEEEIDELRDVGGLDSAGAIVGTLGYAAPEAVAGDNDRITVRSDVYSLTAMLFEILTGRTPFVPPLVMDIEQFQAFRGEVTAREAPRADALDADVPKGLADLCAKGLALDARERHGTVAELRAAVVTWRARQEARARSSLLAAQAHEVLAEAEDLRGGRLLHALRRAQGLVDRARNEDAEVAGAASLLEQIRARTDRAIEEERRASLRRQGRRFAIGALAVALVAAVLFVLHLQRSQRELEDRERRLDAAWVKAEGLIGYLLNDVGSSLEAVGLRAELRDAVHTVRRYYAEAPEPSSLEGALQRARQLFPLGHQLVLDGRAAEALEMHRPSIALLERWRAEDTGDGRLPGLLARHHVGLGRALSALGQPGEAMEAFGRAVHEHTDGIGSMAEARRVSQGVWALKEMGAHQLLRDPVTARRSFWRALALNAELQAFIEPWSTWEGNPEARHAVPRMQSTLHRGVAATLIAEGRPDEAGSRLEKAVSLMRTLRQRWDGPHRSIDHGLAQALTDLALHRLRQDERPAAADLLEEARRIHDDLIERSPTTGTFVRTATQTLAASAYLALRAGARKEAARHAGRLHEVVAASGLREWFPLTLALAVELEAAVADEEPAAALRRRADALRGAALRPPEDGPTNRRWILARHDLQVVQRLLLAFAAHPHAGPRWRELAATATTRLRAATGLDRGEGVDGNGK